MHVVGPYLLVCILQDTCKCVGSTTVLHVGRYAFRPVSTTETVAEESSEDEMTEKILLG